jgi:DNA-binding HxlR family transcriptional regulator/peroxiredoxin
MPDVSDPDCAISQALAVVGQGWTLLVVRDLAGGLSRFDELQASLGVPRKTLADRLALLVAEGVVERRAYSQRPPRSSYHLTARGLGLLPVLIALQDWGTRHVLGDGSVTGAAEALETRRVHDLVGSTVPGLHLGGVDPVVGWTVLFCFPGAFAPAAVPDRDSYPPGWSDIPGTRGCTLEAITYRDRAGAFTELGVTVHGVSTQRTDQQQAFADWAALPFRLLSDIELRLTGALRLPTFRAAGVDRLKRVTLLVDPGRVVQAVQYPVSDPAGSVDDMLQTASRRAPS